MLPYEEIAAKKQQIRQSLIPKEWLVEKLPDQDNLMTFPEKCGVLTEKEVKITSQYDSVDLVKEISKGVYTAEEVTIAFCKRSAIAQQTLNCITEIMFEDAIQHAKKLDEHFKKTGSVVGPLHGLPVSLKDSMNVKGVDSTIGVTALAFQPEKENSPVVDALEMAGAVMICKTAVPQSMMVLDTDNFTFGPARNPWSKYITTAGSSGGSGAIVAMRGSLVSIGTDIGGSIRVPAYANGVYGFKPSSGRIPYYNIKGYWPPGEEYNGILCVDGPIAVSMRDCELIVKSISGTKPWLYDPTCICSPWPQEVPAKEKLSIGVIKVDTLEPITSILKEAIAKLEAAGHEIVEVEFLEEEKLQDIASELFKVDGGEYLIRKSYETMEPLTPMVLDNGLFPCDKSDLLKFFSLCSEKMTVMRKWNLHWQNTKNLTKSGEPVDCLIMPTYPWLPRVKETQGGSTILPWNTLDYPALNFPVETVDLQKHDIEFPELPDTPAGQRLLKQFPDNLRNHYQKFPVGIQLVGRRLEEAKLFQDFGVISRCFDNVQ